MERPRKRSIRDFFLNASTYLASGIALFLLASVFVYVFANGSSLISWNLLSGDYNSTTTNYSYSAASSQTYADPGLSDASFSSRWGVAFADGEDYEGNAVVLTAYLDPASPFEALTDSSGTLSSVEVGEYVSKAILLDSSGNLIVTVAKDKAAAMAASFDEGISITAISITTPGGGIRGSLLSTGLVIVMSLALAMPLGVAAAIYFTQFAPRRKWVSAIQRMIDITSGVPSIIFGLIGASVFIPLMDGTIASSGGSLASGALTLVIILLPTIVKTSEEAFLTVPDEYKSASLALGASRNQTLWKVTFPNAMPGIITALILAIGRIIGESAALVYAIGAFVSDSVSVNGKSTTLAVQIWTVMSGENPNYRLACAISIVILAIVLALSIAAKVAEHRLRRMGGKT
jgi:phosphate transport system permease protein